MSLPKLPKGQAWCMQCNTSYRIVDGRPDLGLGDCCKKIGMRHPYLQMPFDEWMHDYEKDIIDASIDFIGGNKVALQVLECACKGYKRKQEHAKYLDDYGNRYCKAYPHRRGIVE